MFPEEVHIDQKIAEQCADSPRMDGMRLSILAPHWTTGPYPKENVLQEESENKEVKRASSQLRAR